MYLNGSETVIQFAFVLSSLGLVGASLDDSIDLMKKVSGADIDTSGSLLAKTIYLPIGALFGSIAGLVYSVFAVPISLLDATAQVGTAIVTAIFGGGADFLNAGWQTSIMSLFSGMWTYLGPFRIVLVFGIFLTIFWMFAQYRSMDVTGNFIPGFADIKGWVPLVGSDEDEA